MLDPSDDLTTVSDGLETVTLLRRGSTSGLAGTVIAHALRRAISAAEAAIVTTGDVHKNVPSDGQYAAAAVVWHLPVTELPMAPQLGDVILDGQGQRWTILEVKRTTLGTRWRCETRDVTVAFGLDDTISVLKTVAGDGGSILRTSGRRASVRESSRSRPKSPPPAERPAPPRGIAFSWRRIWNWIIPAPSAARTEPSTPSPT